jgi:putative addiction module killer protein
MDIREYLTNEGRSPFGVWLGGLRDVRTRARIRIRLDRVRLGNLGDYRSVGNGIYELRLAYGPGYRLYFGIADRTTVVLLAGGNKRTQQSDIIRAKHYWTDYWEHENVHK